MWRVDPEPRVVQRTIDVGTGVTDVAYGLGSVWALNSLRGTVSRIDPETNRVVAKVALGNTPRQIAVGAGGVWVTVAGAAGAPVAAAGEVPEGGPALPAATCGRVFYGGAGVPDRLIVSDMPLRGGGSLPTLQMSEAIAHVLRQRGFRAGRLRIGYQSCDDSTAQAGIADEEKCAANAKLYAETPAVIGVIGPFNSYCAIGQIPIANRARLAMISPTNSDVALTHPTPLAPEGHLEDLYPTGERNYVRVYPRDDAQAAAAALFARDARARRVAVLSDGGYGEGFAFHFSRTARRLGLDVVLRRRWNKKARRYDRLADAVARAAPDAVYVAGLFDANGGRVIRNLRARLAPGTQLIANDGFLPVAKLFETAGPAARGVHITRPGLAPDSLPREGRQFVAQFAATQGTRPVYFESVYAAQSAELLLDAIAGSDGTPRFGRRRPAAHARAARPAGQHRLRLRGRHHARARDRLPRPAWWRLRTGDEHGRRRDRKRHQRPVRAAEVSRQHAVAIASPAGGAPKWLQIGGFRRHRRCQRGYSFPYGA